MSGERGCLHCRGAAVSRLLQTAAVPVTASPSSFWDRGVCGDDVVGLVSVRLVGSQVWQAPGGASNTKAAFAWGM